MVREGGGFVVRLSLIALLSTLFPSRTHSERLTWPSVPSSISPSSQGNARPSIGRKRRLRLPDNARNRIGALYIVYCSHTQTQRVALAAALGLEASVSSTIISIMDREIEKLHGVHCFIISWLVLLNIFGSVEAEIFNRLRKVGRLPKRRFLYYITEDEALLKPFKKAPFQFYTF